MEDILPYEVRKNVEVCIAPNQFELHRQNYEIIVVIDVLRATSAICAAFHTGVDKIIPVSTVEEAEQYKGKGFIVAAEREGKVVEGFDFGNSPLSYLDSKLKGQTIVLTTTNGTKVINLAKDAGTVVVGSLLNLDVLSNWLIAQNENVLLLCSGWQGKVNLEDTICAGAIAEQLLNSGHYKAEEDASIAAKYLYLSARENYIGFLKASSHRRRLKKLNLNEDIKYCLTPNQTPVIPILKNNVLQNMAEVRVE